MLPLHLRVEFVEVQRYNFGITWSQKICSWKWRTVHGWTEKKDEHGKTIKDSNGKDLFEKVLSNKKIYIFLWSKPSAIGIDTAAFCHALEYMIVYTCTQSDTERSGKKVGEILTTNQSLLKDLEVEKLLFLEENLFLLDFI